MRPKLKISNLINLQDARSSAAVGFDLISFSLERGNDKKLSASLIWNIVNWLSGPGIVLEMNVASLEELSEVEKMFSWKYITIPASEWNDLIFSYTDAVILRTDHTATPEEIQRLVQLAESMEKELKFEIQLPAISAAKTYSAVAKHIFFHFPDIDEAEAYIQSGDFQPYGFSFGEEAEEEPGLLNYQRIDDFLEIFADHFPESGHITV
ncbi:MAG: hypothetical protein R3D00_03725 [Bacteroidia bacterium]